MILYDTDTVEVQLVSYTVRYFEVGNITYSTVLPSSNMLLLHTKTAFIFSTKTQNFSNAMSNDEQYTIIT